MTTEPASSKILSHEDLLALRAAARREGRKVVQCHGCFDIVHPGHIRHLRQAKGLGDILLVSITGDAGVGKGVGRPLIPEELRAENLASLDFVDWVYVERRATAAGLLGEVRPDVYVKGKEYESNTDPRFAAEREAVRKAGGRVVFSSGDVVFSSTALIAAMESSVDPFHKRLAELSGKSELEAPGLYALVSAFRGKRVLVVGETILDTYVLCDRPDVAGESPIMTLRPLERRRYDAGAAIIARHAAALGAHPVLITAMPRGGEAGEEAEALRRRLAAEGVDVRSVSVPNRIAEKQRFLVGTQKVMKLDLLEPIVLDAAQQEMLVSLVVRCAKGEGIQAAVLADFGQGLFSPGLLGRLCKELRPHVGLMAGDVSGRRSHLGSMLNMDLLTPSESELRDATGQHDESLPAVAWRLLERTRSRAAIVTMGPDGLVAFDRLKEGESGRIVEGAKGRVQEGVGEGVGEPGASGGPGWPSRLKGEHVPAMCPYAVDALGCGDAMLTAAVLSLASGGSILPAAFIGAAAASVQAQRIGNNPIDAADLRRAIARVHSAHLTFAGADVVRAARVDMQQDAGGEAALRSA